MSRDTFACVSPERTRSIADNLSLTDHALRFNDGLLLCDIAAIRDYNEMSNDGLVDQLYTRTGQSSVTRRGETRSMGKI